MDNTTLTIVDKIKTLVPSRQIAADKRAKVGTTNPKARPESTNKLFTAKDKAVLGIDEDRSITWSIANFTAEDSERFRLIAKESGTTPTDLGARIIMQWFEDNRQEIDEIVGEVLTKTKSADDIEKQYQAALRQVERLKAKLGK